MSNTLRTKIRQPISKNILEAIRKEFRDISVEKGSVDIISRGFTLHNLLKEISKESKEVIIAEHSLSIDLYSTLYVEQYKDGNSETLETKNTEIIMHKIVNTEKIEEKILNKKVIDKNLISALLKGAIGQAPKEPTNDVKMLQDYNLAFNVILIAAEDIVNPSDKIDIDWCIDYVYELYNGPIKYF